MAKTIRRAIAILLALTAVMLLVIPALDVNASYTKGDYVVDGGTLVSYTGSDSDITIPIGISSIGKDAFSGNNNLVKVYIPDEVTSIDYAAFENCKNLVKVDIGDGVRNIGQSAFSGCQNLTEINIPKYVENIGSGAFAACPNLSDISVSEKNRNYVCLDGVLYTKDGKKMVQYLAGRPYSTYDIPQPVKEIEEFGFYGSNMLTTVSIVHGVEEIPEYAFLNCTALNQVNIPSSVKAIRKGAFGGCPNLTKLDVPTSVGLIDPEAFTSMDGKKGDVVNEATGEVLSESGDLSALDVADTTSLQEEQTIPDNALVAGNEDEVLPQVGVSGGIIDNPQTGELASTTIVGGNAVFLLNPKDMKVQGFDINAAQTEDSIADSGNSSSEGDDIRSTSGLTFDVISDVFGHYGGNDSSVTLPEGLSKIGNRVFYNNKNITNVSMPTSVKEIGDFAFARSSLQSIDIPAGTERIGYAAFYNCDNLTNINVPSTIKEIELGAFDGSGFINNWRGIEDGNNFLILGDGILVAYKGHGSQVTIPSSVSVIGPGVFEGNTRLKSVTIPETVLKISEDAFNGCKNLTEIEIPKNVEIIEDRAFKDTNLKNVSLPQNIKQLGLGAFDTKRINGGMDAVIFKGVQMPDVTYKPTATRLSASNLRTPVFNGTKYAFVPDSANLNSGTIFDESEIGFRGEVYSGGDVSDDGLRYVKLRKCTKEPEKNGMINIAASVKIGKNSYDLSGISETAFDSYRDLSWCKSPVSGITVSGESSSGLVDLISDINNTIQNANVGSDNQYEQIDVNVTDGSMIESAVKAVLPSSKDRFKLNIKRNDSLKQNFNVAFDNRYGNHDGLNLYTMDIDMTDRTGTIPIKKMATSKLEITMPVPKELASADRVRLATLDDNGLLEEIACEVSDFGDNNKTISFVASHLSPYAIFVRANEELIFSEDNTVIETEEVTISDSFASNTVNVITGTVVYGTLQKEVVPGVPARYLVIVILFSLSVTLFLYKGKRKPKIS